MTAADFPWRGRRAHPSLQWKSQRIIPAAIIAPNCSTKPCESRRFISITTPSQIGRGEAYPEAALPLMGILPMTSLADLRGAGAEDGRACSALALSKADRRSAISVSSMSKRAARPWLSAALNDCRPALPDSHLLGASPQPLWLFLAWTQWRLGDASGVLNLAAWAAPRVALRPPAGRPAITPVV